VWVPSVYLLLKTFKLFGLQSSIMRVTDEGYSRNALCALSDISRLVFTLYTDNPSKYHCFYNYGFQSLLAFVAFSRQLFISLEVRFTIDILNYSYRYNNRTYVNKPCDEINDQICEKKHPKITKKNKSKITVKCILHLFRTGLGFEIIFFNFHSKPRSLI